VFTTDFDFGPDTMIQHIELQISERICVSLPWNTSFCRGCNTLGIGFATQLLSVYSRYGLRARRVANATFYTEGFSGFVASAAASIESRCLINASVTGSQLLAAKLSVMRADDPV
jgi:hypothetical protein